MINTQFLSTHSTHTFIVASCENGPYGISASLAQAQHVHLHSLVRGDAVRYQFTQVLWSHCVFPDQSRDAQNGRAIAMMGAYGIRPIFE